MKPAKPPCRDECEPARPKRKAVKKYGIESRRVNSPISWVRDWHSYRWYAKESARDTALESALKREAAWLNRFPKWMESEYRKVDR